MQNIIFKNGYYEMPYPDKPGFTLRAKTRGELQKDYEHVINYQYGKKIQNQ
jgi:hypothetical protein